MKITKIGTGDRCRSVINKTVQFHMMECPTVSRSYAKYDSNGRLLSYTTFDSQGREYMRIDLAGRAHAGVLPHIQLS